MSKTSESKQMAVLRFIYERVNEKGYPPTVREIGEAVDLSSTSTVHGHIHGWRRKAIFKKTQLSPVPLR